MANLNQLSLLSQSKVTEVYLRDNHELVQIADILDWDDLILMAMNCRSSKVKKETGPQPRYRELLGAVVLMAVKGFDYGLSSFGLSSNLRSPIDSTDEARK